MLHKLNRAAKEMEVNVETLRRLARRKKIPFYRVGRSVRVDLDELKKFFREEAQAGAGF